MTNRDVDRRTRREQRDHQLRRFFLLTAGSTIVPGSGLLATRRRAVGAAVLGLFVAALAVLLFKFGTQGLMHTALNIGVNRGKLLFVLCALVVGAVVWCGAILLTAVTTTPPGIGSVDTWSTRLFTALCCVLVILPSVFIGRTIAIQRDVIGTVFQSGDTTTTGAAQPDTAKKDPWASIPRVNMMLIGSDAGRGRIGVRSDSMMVASINTKTGDTVLIGLPRNLDRVPFAADDPLHALYPDGFHCIDPAAGVNTNCLLNGIWTEAENHPELFPGDKAPGYTETRRALSMVTGLTINQSLIIDLAGFQQLVSSMGGVTIQVKSRICMDCKSDGNGGIIWSKGVESWIEPGRQHLNGKQALWYARSRAQSDDFSRMRRQRCVVGALLDQSNPVKLLANYASLAKVLKQNVDVDIAQADLPAWVDLVQRIQGGTIRSLPITDQIVNVNNPDYAKIRALVKTAISPPKATATPTKPTSTATKPSSTASSPGGTTSTTENDGLTTLAAAC